MWLAQEVPGRYGGGGEGDGAGWAGTYRSPSWYT